jgi:hypothetical protein
MRLPLIAAFLFVSATAFADDDTCPVTTHDEHFLDNVVKAMKGKSCARAAAIAERCALGASGNAITAGAASKLCQADHAKTDKPLFESLAKRCATKYAAKSGTMYQSAAAFCELDVAVLLSRLDAKVE